MRVVVACDKFRGSQTAAEVADALERGLRRADPDVTVLRVPVADGGEGTLQAAVEFGFERCPVEVDGPDGERVATAYARQGDRGLVELADASGLDRLAHGPAPLVASTIGTGQLIAAAVQAGVREIVLGIGGSSSTDGGAGLAVGLGARVLDDSGRPVGPGGLGLATARSLDLAPVRERLAGVSITLACDVDNPLLGPDGAAAVYGPQKGAGQDDIRTLERGLEHWADLVAATTGRDLRERPGAGAAGGTGFGAIALLDAQLRSGVETVLELVGFAVAAAGADLVITGEGSIDEQSLRGKAPVGVLRAASAIGVPCVAVCGRTTLDPATLRDAGLERVWSLSDLEPDQDRSMADAARLLEEVGVEVGRWLSARQ